MVENSKFLFRLMILLVISHSGSLSLKSQPVENKGDTCCPKCQQLGLTRYKDDIFPKEAITMVTSTYAHNVVNWVGNSMYLQMDIYRNPNCDHLKRPCVLMIHGGALKHGSRVNNLSTYFGMALARKGYVVATIDYRQGWITDKFIDSLLKSNPDQVKDYCETDPLNCLTGIEHMIKHPKQCSGRTHSIYEAAYRAIQDVRTSIRYLKANAKEFGIDPDFIVLSGYSAGGVLALHAQYLDKEEIPSWFTEEFGPLDVGTNLDQNTKIKAIINNWGALFNLKYMDNNPLVPMLMIHGTCDRVVPYYIQHFGNCKSYPILYGSHAIYQYAKKFQLPISLELHTACGYKHNVTQICSANNKYSPARMEELLQKTAAFLYELTQHDMPHEIKQTFFSCKPCYCGDCNSSSFTYNDPACGQKCNYDSNTGNNGERGAAKNPYLPGNPEHLPYPCTNE